MAFGNSTEEDLAKDIKSAWQCIQQWSEELESRGVMVEILRPTSTSAMHTEKRCIGQKVRITKVM